MSLLNFLRFQSPGTPQKEPVVNPDVVASAVAQPAPTHLITRVSGTEEMTTIGLPWAGFEGTIYFLPTGVFTGATGGTSDDEKGAIGKAFTAVVGQPLALTYIAATGLWYPGPVS